MSTRCSVILIEFNELCPSLINRFMNDGKLPNFKRMYQQAHVYTSDAEAEPPYLEPWIQWVTVHSGLTYSDHGIFHLGEGHKLREKRVWDVLSAAGRRV